MRTSKTKVATGLLMIVTGIALGLYAGLWWAFIGGIVQVIEAVKATPVDALAVGVGSARVVFAAFIGGVSAMVLVAPGAAILKSA
jgi:hypothetical protein